MSKSKKSVTPTEQAETVAEAVTPTEAVTPAEQGKRGRGRPRNAERTNITLTRTENGLDVNAGGMTLRYTHDSPAPFIPSASVITAEAARVMANVLGRAPCAANPESFVNGLKAIGNLDIEGLVTAVQYCKGQ